MPILQSEGQLRSVAGTNILGAGSPWNYVPSLDYRDRAAMDYAAIYSTQPSVQRVVSFLAEAIAQVGLHAFRRVSDTERVRLDQSHPLARLIASPNPDMTRFDYIEAMVIDLAIYGNHFSVKTQRADTGDLGLTRIPPQYVGTSEANWLNIETYSLQVGDTKFDVPSKRMFHLKRHNPADPRWGLSPLEALRMVLDETAASAAHRESYWRNAARHEGVLEMDKKLTPQAALRLRADWQAMYAGDENAGKTLILEEGLKFKPTSFSARDSQYLEARKLTVEEVAGAYHVSPANVGILEHANFANVDAQHRMLYQDTLGPWMVRVEEEFERQILPDIEDTENVYLEFNIHEKLKGSFEEETKALQSAIGAPYMTRNEGRARRNLAPVDGGDELVTPLNVLTGGQASPLDADPNKEASASHKGGTNGHGVLLGALKEE